MWLFCFVLLLGFGGFANTLGMVFGNVYLPFGFGLGCVGFACVCWFGVFGLLCPRDLG